ncbi:epidermal growth factor receptor-like isoform X3 [Clavelina lepadiformis]|uniref:epidermal growth factor receptor-like isoform X3 n=1 Tax=Clavelina lepadiformis TaxID=159417 RepID=UPI0040423F25
MMVSKTSLNMFCTAVLLLLICVFVQTTTSANCTNAKCAEPLRCDYPKKLVTLPDPRDPECCMKTVCTCKGTSNRASSDHDAENQLNTLRKHYTNCTIVDGNLEIVFVDSESSNIQSIDFTKHIEEVTGYVLISRVSVHHIDLSSLYLIRGIEQYHKDSTVVACREKTINTTTSDSSKLYSLYVKDNEGPPNKALRELWLPKLTEISSGNVEFVNNPYLCYIHTVKWYGEIFSDRKSGKVPQNLMIDNSVNVSCPACPNACIHDSVVPRMSRCWGNSPDLCQTITKSSCGNCNNRCNQQGRCCSDDCAAGCLNEGESTIDYKTRAAEICHACKDVNDNGTCVKSCPDGRKVDSNNNQFQDRPTKVQFLRYCLDECPPNTPQTAKKYCTTFCPEGWFDYEKNMCTECKGGKCENICYGLGLPHGPLKDYSYIRDENLQYFNKNCTIIEGSLYFTPRTFEGVTRKIQNSDVYCEYPALGDLRKLEVFENVREITGYLNVEDWKLNDLSIFKNLRRIHGKELKDQQYSLTVYTSSTTLRELSLNSLERIDNGAVNVQQNPLLCYSNTITWDQITNTTASNDVSHNRASDQCVPCDNQCDPASGCWGKEATECVRCNRYTDLTDKNGQVVPEWVEDSDGNVYPGNNVTTCVGVCDYTKGVYATSERTCLPCHDECEKQCTGPGSFNCTRCKNFDFDGECVSKCPETTYSDLVSNNTCRLCSANCMDGGCTGPNDAFGKDGCTICYHFVDKETNRLIYHGSQCKACKTVDDGKCEQGCMLFNSTGVWECYIPPQPDYTVYYVIGALVILVAVTILGFMIYRHKKTINRMKKTIGDTMVGEHAQPESEAMPLTPSGAAPNQAQLRIVKENELAMGKLLGTGAFGEVHKAIWTPLNIQGEKVKIAVAVKTLKTPEEMSHAANNEIMDEAYMMASVDCIYLVRLLGVSMTNQVSLITQLMPLGSLLEYVRGAKNTDSIRCRQMLTWFVQIAKGMQYLEEKHLVHRDLAARNVLVKTPNHVKITDFGLAKMLDVKEDTYQAEGGKLPIKWLAIECITERKFSHYSDVWAYGITCWELLTYGARPYEGVRAVEVLSLLERGDRLQQPPTATIDVYMLLIKCWMVDKHCRPTFKELVSEFSKMASDPSRYIVMMKNEDPSSCLSPSPVDEASFFRQLMDDEKIDDHVLADEPDQYLLTNGVTNQYTPMSTVDESLQSRSALVPHPVYTNQSSIDKANSAAEMQYENKRLFSRSTPSANVDPVPSTSAVRGSAEVNRRGNSNSDQDDVFSDFSKSFHPSSSNSAAPSTSRKDSEETQRYTEDPTNKKRHYLSRGLATQELPEETPGGKFSYDDDQYLLPTPSKNPMPVYFDPEGLHPPTQEVNHPLSSVMNETYVESPPPASMGPNSPPEEDNYGHLAMCTANPAPEHDYINTSGENHSPTWFANEEYMATDSGIGDDTQSLLSRGNTGNRDKRKESTQSSTEDNDRLLFNDSKVHFKPNSRAGPTARTDPLWSSSSAGSSSSPSTAVENPEYMLFNSSASNNKNIKKDHLRTPDHPPV